MAETTYRTIVIQAGPMGVNRQEALAGEAGIKPGHLLEISSGKVVTHNTADGFTQKLVALESQHAYSETLPTIDVVYADGDTVYYTQAAPGDVLYMLLAASENVTLGVTPLVSNADGTLKAAVIGAGTLEGAVVGVAMTTSNVASVQRIKVRIV